MTTIQVTKETREKIRAYSNDESVDKALNRLLDESSISDEDYKRKSRRKSKTNIAISSDTFDRLKRFKLSDEESHSDTICRLIDELDD